MKKTSNALHTISSASFLRDAWKGISKSNVRSKGVDNVTIRAFKNNLDKHLDQISRELRAKQYLFNKLRPHAIKKAGSNKYRPLQIATVRDRVVMKALALHIGPSFAALDQSCSFAFIKGRGVNNVVGRIQKLVNNGFRYYFEADIIDFFGSVNRDILWRNFSKRVRSKSLLPLLWQAFNLELANLEEFQTEFQNLFAGANSGIPQGGVLSPLLANFYLHEFDNAMLESGFQLVRYADDFVVFCKSRSDAKEAYEFSKSLLESIGLRIHELGDESKSRLGDYAKDGLMFLGLRFEGNDAYPTSKAVLKFKAKVKEVLDTKSGDTLFRTLQRLTNLINGWGNSYRKMKVRRVYLDLDEFIKVEVYTYLSKKGIRLAGSDRRKQMRFLGIPSLSALLK